MSSLSIQNPTVAVSDAVSSGAGSGFFLWLSGCHGFIHNIFMIIPSTLFVLFLAFQVRKSLSKLNNGRSNIIYSYYAILWLVSLLNLTWCALQVWECAPGKKILWNTLSLFTDSGMLFLEVSLIAFLLQGNYASGLEALARTFAVSLLMVGFDIFLKAIYVFALGIPLFIANDHGEHRLKWGLWVVHKLVLTAVYCFILIMYHSKWRERLPARPAFQKYINIMFTVNAMAIVACALTGNVAGLGFWLYDTTIIGYHAFYLPLLYVTFLADFFQEEAALNFDNVYYSEMKDAGFFEADWA